MEIKTLGTRIRLLRHQKNWNQDYVAERLHLSTPAYSKIETGVTDVNLSRLQQISTLFELTVTQLLSFEEGDQEQDNELEILTKTARTRKRGY